MGHRLTKFALAGAATALLAVAIFVYSRPEQKRLHEADLQPVPVIAARVQQRDVPIILTGLGTVTALNTATVRSQITGC
jgi:membrane fusion protein, multidrug efflux system